MNAPALPARGDGVQTWATPWHIVRAIEAVDFGGVPFDLDACAQPHTAKATRFYSLEAGHNGKRDPWRDHTWCNPPYEEQDEWIAKGVYEAEERGVNSAHLVLASTSSKYWRRMTFERGTVDFYEGRIAFLDETGTPVKGASFSSALVLLGPKFRAGVVRVRDAVTGALVGAPMHMDLFR